ncbi:FmdB family zinc ribbon protein [Pseudonocardia saturnea]
MPIYVYKCECGYRFEHLASFDAAAPGCPECGGATRKIPAGFSLGGQANAGLSKEQMPQTWRGTYNGSREYVTGLRRQWDRRQQVEARHPELAGDQRPIIAHEGRFHDAPLRQGDQVIGTTGPGTGHGHGHGHGGHGAAAPAGPTAAKPTSGPAGGSPGGGTH